MSFFNFFLSFRINIGSSLKFYKTDSGDLEVMTQSDEDEDHDDDDDVSTSHNHNGGPGNGNPPPEGDDIQHEVDFEENGGGGGGKMTRRTNRRGE